MSIVVRNAVIALGVTALILGTVIAAVSYLNRERIAELTAIESQLSIDTLSLDTQFSILESAPCSVVDDGTELTAQLNDLGERLAYMESQLGSNDTQVTRLKQQYSLLEIRDYLVTKQLAKACGTKPVTVLYFYSNAGDCPDCERAGAALSYLHDQYPALRVYSFDYHLELGALKTFIAVDKVQPRLPAFIIQGRTYYGFTDLAALEKAFHKGALATTTAANGK